VTRSVRGDLFNCGEITMKQRSGTTMRVAMLTSVFFVAMLGSGQLSSFTVPHTAYALSAAECMEPFINPRWNLECKQAQNWGSGNPTSEQGMAFYYRSTSPTVIKYSFNTTSFARIHIAYGTGPKNSELAHYPRRTAEEAADRWDDSNYVSDLSIENTGSSIRVDARRGADFNTSFSKDFSAVTHGIRSRPANQCGDGAQARCYPSVSITINGSWGWLPSHDSPVTFCCRMNSGTGSAAPESAGIIGMDQTFLHEFGHALGLKHTSEAGVCPPGGTTAMTQDRGAGNVASCNMNDPSLTDKVAMRFFYGKP